MRNLRKACVVALAIAATGGAASARAAGAPEGRIGPSVGPLLNTGRLLTPYGQLVGLGNFPTGGAVTPDGRFYWTLSTGRGRNDVRIIDVRSAA